MSFAIGSLLTLTALETTGIRCTRDAETCRGRRGATRVDLSFLRFPRSAVFGGLKPQRNSKGLWRSQRIKSRSVLQGGADFPTAFFVAGKSGIPKPVVWGTYGLHPGFPWFSSFSWFP